MACADSRPIDVFEIFVSKIVSPEWLTAFTFDSGIQVEKFACTRLGYRESNQRCNYVQLHIP